MQLTDLEPGDMVFAAVDILNDGSLETLPPDAPLARAGNRGVLLNTGHLEQTPDQAVYLVRFERPGGDLGPAVGCWPEELTAEPGVPAHRDGAP
ncbi:MAG: nitrogen fixation protein NifZ [Pseudomonadota bacterium]|nr:nitrogen fixation protein NifZ [Pseudomonadota bacterium]